MSKGRKKVATILEQLARVGLTPSTYLATMKRQAAADPADLADPADREKLEFTRLNLHRTERIARTWRPSSELAELIACVTTPQTWLVLTEPWCGDSAQCLPCIVTLAELQPAVTLRLVLRDENPDLMDRYLTNGKRSIPRLVALDAGGAELFSWGPRPAAAQEIFAAARDEGLEKPDILQRLHLFYGRNRGAALDAEFVTLLSNYLDGAP
jgi:hypothetical protein